MWRVSFRSCLLGFALASGSSAAFAQCTEERRGLPIGDNVVQLRTYQCSTGQGPNDARVGVEIHRLSDLAASITVTRRTSETLKRVIGSPRLVENDVSRAYSDLLGQFGIAAGRLGKENLKVDGAGGGGSADASQENPHDSIRILSDSNFDSLPVYPAVVELDALRRKVIPSGLRYYYNVVCRDEAAGLRADMGSICRNYDRELSKIFFWRGMRLDDVTNYPRRVAELNSRIGSQSRRSVAIPRSLRLASHLAGNNWPDDFMIMSGTLEEDGCASGPSAGLSYGLRAFMLDVAVIENLSKIPVTVSDILGGRPADGRLRVATSSLSQSNAGQALGIVVGTLAPGEKALVPLRIHLAPNEHSTSLFRYRQTAAQIQRLIGASGYNGNVGGFSAPAFRSYAWGPEVVMGGLVVNGARIDLRNRSANYVEMTMSSEEGSCPFLLSQAKDGYWVDHGKVLHRAPNKENEYSEIRSFQGFRSNFRLEEREPEIAFIDQAEVVITLNNGDTLTLAPDNAMLAARDGDYLRLYWGEAVEIKFALPEGIGEEAVIESRFSVTGYYVRYSTLMAKDVIRRISPLDAPQRINIGASCPIAPKRGFSVDF